MSLAPLYVPLGEVSVQARDSEIKNNLTIARGEGGRDSGEKGFRNYCKGHMDKTKGEGGSKGGRWVWLV